MLFVCRNCGATTADIDMILDGACECGSTHFKLVSENSPKIPAPMAMKEEIRRNLHTWVDLNIDSMDSSKIGNMRVIFECDQDENLVSLK
jgi:predicted  nucleic acid-binding Zn-ribbon protein